jgi:hypothetical protein
MSRINAAADKNNAGTSADLIRGLTRARCNFRPGAFNVILGAFDAALINI